MPCRRASRRRIKVRTVDSVAARNERGLSAGSLRIPPAEQGDAGGGEEHAAPGLCRPGWAPDRAPARADFAGHPGDENLDFLARGQSSGAEAPEQDRIGIAPPPRPSRRSAGLWAVAGIPVRIAHGGLSFLSAPLFETISSRDIFQQYKAGLGQAAAAAPFRSKTAFRAGSNELAHRVGRDGQRDPAGVRRAFCQGFGEMQRLLGRHLRRHRRRMGIDQRLDDAGSRCG